MRKTFLILLALISLQGLLIAGWWWIERGRSISNTVMGPGLWTRNLKKVLPPLSIEGPEGTWTELVTSKHRPFILHFWATWCPPCREELPVLLEYAQQAQLEILAVSVDSEWTAIEAMLGSELSPAVVRASGAAVGQAFDIGALPVTFLVDREGVIRTRIDGAVDWQSVGDLQVIQGAVGQ